VDLRTIGDLSRYFREQVQQEALVIYEQDWWLKLLKIYFKHHKVSNIIDK
jgi:hypothetical protein